MLASLRPAVFGRYRNGLPQKTASTKRECALGWNTWVHEGDYGAVLSDASFFVEAAAAGV